MGSKYLHQAPKRMGQLDSKFRLQAIKLLVVLLGGYRAVILIVHLHCAQLRQDQYVLENKKHFTKKMYFKILRRSLSRNCISTTMYPEYVMYGSPQVKCRLLISSIFDAMNFQHFSEMLYSHPSPSMFSVTARKLC